MIYLIRNMLKVLLKNCLNNERRFLLSESFSGGVEGNAGRDV